jgi:hypothetical protein
MRASRRGKGEEDFHSQLAAVLIAVVVGVAAIDAVSASAAGFLRLYLRALARDKRAVSSAKQVVSR